MQARRDAEHARRSVERGWLAPEVAEACRREAAERRTGFLHVAVERGLLSVERARALSTEAATEFGARSPSTRFGAPATRFGPVNSPSTRFSPPAQRPPAEAMPAGPGAGPARARPPSAGAPIPSDVIKAGRAAPPGRRRPTLAALPRAGEELGGYRVLRLLGKGCMGAVYLARKGGIDHALKVIRPTADPGFLDRFEREAQAIAAVDRHPNIVRIHSFGRERGLPFFVLDYIEGETLEDRLRERGTLPLEPFLELLEKVADALDFIHARGIVHRDLKPSNILLREEDDEPFLADFGLAFKADAKRLTQSGTMVGTPYYMPPEQVRGRHGELGPHSDVWSLGVILYEGASGQKPFVHPLVAELAQMIKRDDPAPLSSVMEACPKALELIVARALRRDPRDRYPTAASFAADCRALRGGRLDRLSAPSSRKLRRWAFGGLLALVVLIAAGLRLESIRGHRLRRDAALERWRDGLRQARGALTSSALSSWILGDEALAKAAGALEQLEGAARAVEDDAPSGPLASLLTGGVDAGDRRRLERAGSFFAALGGARTAARPPLNDLIEASSCLRERRFSAALASFRRLEEGRRDRVLELPGRSLSVLAAAGRALAFEGLERWDEALAEARSARSSEADPRLMTILEGRLLEGAAFASCFDEEASIDRQVERWQALRDYASTAPELGGWERWNARLAERFQALEGPASQRQAALEGLAQAWRRLERVAEGLPELRLPEPGAELHAALGFASRRDRPRAFYHFLRAAALDEDFALPPGFRRHEVGGRVLGLQLSRRFTRADLREGLDYVLAAHRAGVYFPVMSERLADRLEQLGLFDEAIKAAPRDPYPLYWKSWQRPPSEARERRRAAAEWRRLLEAVLAFEDLIPSVRARALERLVGLQIELGRVDSSKTDGDRARWRRMIEESIALGHPAADRAYLILQQLSDDPERRLAYLDKAEVALEERSRRASRGAFLNDPVVEPLSSDDYDQKSVELRSYRAEVFEGQRRLEAAEQAWRSVLAVRRSARNLRKLGEFYLRQGRLNDARALLTAHLDLRKDGRGEPSRDYAALSKAVAKAAW